MSGAGSGSLKPMVAARRVQATGNRWMLSLLLVTIALTALIAVVVAAAVGQSTVALVVGLVTAAFFAGIMC